MRETRQRLSLLLLASVPILSGCGSGGGQPSGVGAGGTAALLSVEYGSLVDVYGFRKTASGGFTTVLYAQDVLIGADIVDERDGANRDKRDNEILYDFLSANPDNLQPRLLITREIGTEEFARGFDALDTRVRRVAPGRFGQDTTQTPFTVMPRNGAMRVTFSRDLGLDPSFFYEMQDGQIIGVKNSEAVQVLRIVGDPNDSNLTGDFQVIPARFVARGAQLIIDPVLLGSEGVRLQVRNQAGGLPEAADQVGANIRLAFALEGPLAIPSLRRDDEAQLTGLNNGGLNSVIRDFRSGNSLDDTAEISRGFRRDPVPPRIVGELLMYLERVEEVDAFTQLLTIYKGEVEHRIDAGDAIRIVSPDGLATQLAITEVVADPRDRKESTHTLVLVRREAALTAADPSKLPGYPADREARELWLPQFAPRAVVVAEFESGDGGATSDDPQYFVRFSPLPLVGAGGVQAPNVNISPFASVIVRFSKPLDINSVRAQDSLFFATKPLTGPEGEQAIQDFLAASEMDPTSFDRNKFITPHLVVGRRFDEDGSQTTIRLQPPLGFYLDDELRLPQNTTFRTYYLHILGGRNGIKDLAGNELDFLASANRLQDSILVDFTLDVRNDQRGQPLYPNNRVVNVARRFETIDEDEQPSYYRRDEIRIVGGPTNDKAYPLEDLFGAVNYFGGRIHARPTARISRVADDLNQQPPPSQDSELRWCPESDGGEAQIAANTAGSKFGQPIQNPLNPYGCRLMTVWREIDLNLSRVDPFDFNLDLEEVHWAPHTNSTIVFDEFDRMSLFVGHSEYRAENCVGTQWALPYAIENSGLDQLFSKNFLRDKDVRGAPEPVGPRNPPEHVGYRDHYVVIDAAMAFTEPNNVNRFMPLPPLQEPYFVWRDETVDAQGGVSRHSSDVLNTSRDWEPYIISPFLTGGGRFVTRGSTGQVNFNYGRWMNTNNYNLRNKTVIETITDGLVGTIALPLLGDFQMYPDEASLPAGRGYIASGANGWQIALTVTSSSVPNFRVYSAGGVANGQIRRVTPGSAQWSRASGGINPSNGQATGFGDNSFYWLQTDFLKRQSVVTAGFVDLLDPHRVDTNFPNRDPRLGPYYPAGAASVLPRGTTPFFATLFEPSLDTLPGGTEIVPQYRGASIVDPRPWIAEECRFPFWLRRNQVKPDNLNFPLDPRKAGDAGLRKYSDQFNANNQARNFWTHTYNLHVTDYVDDPNRLADETFLANFAGPVDSFRANEVRYANWRFIMKNNVVSTPPVSPSLESFALLYRFQESR